MFYIGYTHFVTFLFLVTGILLIRMDVKGYAMAGMKKEEKTARVMGWINVSLGVLIFTANWIYQNWFW